MKNYFKNESGFLPLAAAWLILAFATAGAAGVVTLNHDLNWDALKHGVAEYKVNE